MKTFKFLLVLSITLATFLGCKKEKISTVNRNFSIEVIRSQGGDGVVVGEKIPFKLTIKDFDLQNNLGQIETFFYVRNKGGESKGKFSTSENKDIPIGENFEYDYRKNKMVLDFFFTPTQEGDQEIVAEIRCQSVTKTFTVPLDLRSKNIIITSTQGGKITYQDKSETSYNLSFKYGETIKLKAIPQAKYKFKGWYVDGILETTTLDYIHRVERNTKIEAIFKPMSYKITPKINIAEAGVVTTASGKNTFEDGDLVEVRVTPNAIHKMGYIFKGWYVNNKLVGDQLVYGFNAKDDVEPEARFERKIFAFTYNDKHTKYLINFNSKEDVRQLVEYGKEYALDIEARLINTSRIKEKMTFYFNGFELDKKGMSSISLDGDGQTGGHIVNKRSFKVICRGDMVIRISLTTQNRIIDPNNSSERYLN